MIGFAKFVIETLLVLMFVQQGYSIQCYSCNSHHNPDCSDVTKLEQFIVNCTDEINPIPESNLTSTFCRKFLQTIDFKQNGLKTGPRVLRNCGFEVGNITDGASKNQCIRRVNSGIVMRTCNCDDKDNCNSANAMKSTGLVMTAVLLLVFKYL